MSIRHFSLSSLSSSSNGNDMDEGEGMNLPGAAYPFTRQEECSWHPEEAGRKLSQLLSVASDIESLISGSTYSYHSSSAKTHLEHELNNQHLMSRGWTTTQARYLRSIFGDNSIHGRDDDDDQVDKFLNIIPIPKCCCKMLGRISPWWVPVCSGFISQFNEPLNIMLLVSAAISLMLKQTSDAVSIGLALTIVSLVAAVQEYRSEAALEKLNDLVPHTCTIMRDGAVRDHYPAKHLVVGDLIILSTGDRIPADCRLVDAIELTVDESSLTGENRPVTKIGDAVPFSSNTKAPPLTDQKNIAFMGTLVCSGRARALVVAVGNRTEFGKVASELGKVESRKSPLQVKIDELGKTLAFISSLVIAIMALLGWFLGRPFLETVTVAVSLAVAAIPEGLPICVTVTLALGVLRMAKSNAIVKKLTSVETLGCATVVASDKTGTLTQNEMTARSVYTLAFPSLSFGLTGVGYDPRSGSLYRSIQEEVNHDRTQSQKGDQMMVNEHGMEFAAVRALFECACLCNNATVSISKTRGKVLSSGQPTELALLVGSIKAKVSDPRPQYHRVQEIPFSSDRKRMEVKVRPINGDHDCQAFKIAAKNERLKDENYDGTMYFVKGMPESVLGECVGYLSADGSSTTITEKGHRRVLSQSRRMASSGLRVLAMAYGTSLDNLTFAGIVGMEDPPREGVLDAVHNLQQGGVSVVMVTGDSKETALAIAKRCGIVQSFDDDMSGHSEEVHPSSHNPFDELEFGAGLCLSGEQLDAIPSPRLAESILGIKVFYRVAPRHKLALVRAYQSQGEVVAMTGDGVNDAIALKAADIGVAMGQEGTDVAKEAADVVLADDSFSTIVEAVAGGKGIFFNIRNFLAFQLSTSFAALTMECIATVLGLPSPLNAMQILWINIIMDGPPAQSLGVEPVDERILNAKPRKSTDPLLTKALLLRAISSAILIVFLTLRVFQMEMPDGIIDRRTTTMTFMTFVNCDLFNAYACRSADRCFYEISMNSNPTFLWAVGGSIFGQMMVIFFPPLQEVFQTESLSLHDIIFILLLSSSVLILDTLRKKFFFHFFSDSNNRHPTFIKKAKKMKSGASISFGEDNCQNEIITSSSTTQVRHRLLHL